MAISGQHLFYRRECNYGISSVLHFKSMLMSFVNIWHAFEPITLKPYKSPNLAI